MRPFLSITTLLLLLAMVACANDLSIQPDDNLESAHHDNPYAIPISSALDALDKFRKEDPQTRNSELPSIVETFIIYDNIALIYLIIGFYHNLHTTSCRFLKDSYF